MIITVLTALTTVVKNNYIQTKAAASINYYEIYKQEIQNYVEAGTLQSWHLEFLDQPYYYSCFMKWREDISQVVSLSKTQVQTQVTQAKNKKILTKAEDYYNKTSIPLEELEINKTIGIDFTMERTYFIWTSQFYPHLDFRLQEITINNKTYQLDIMGGSEPHLERTQSLLQDQYVILEKNIQLNFTIIGGIHDCYSTGNVVPYGYFHQDNEIKVTGWKARNLETNELLASNNETITFNVPGDPTEDYYSASQLITHQIDNIKKIKTISEYDEENEKYNHFIYFNSNVEIDDMYRINLGYLIEDSRADEWLTSDEVGSYALNMARYSGIKKGNYEVEGKTFNYELQINAEGDWHVFELPEKDLDEYPNLDQIYYLRICYISPTYNENTMLDCFFGSLLSMPMDESYMESEDYIWKFGEAEEEPITNPDDENKNGEDDKKDDDKSETSDKNLIEKLGTVGSIILGLGIFYLLYCLIHFIIRLFRRKR